MDLCFMEIRTYDFVLGLNWLKRVVYHASWNYDDLAMSFWYDGDLYVLKPSAREESHLISKIDNHVDEGCHLFWLHAIDLLLQQQGPSLYVQNDAGNGIRALLKEYSDVFSELKGSPPFREGHNHPIVLQQGTDPINLQPFRYPAIQRDEIEKQIKDLLQAGVIQNSLSPFVSPIVLVRKKDSSCRMCIDYRERNKKTVKNKYPIPLVEDLLDELRTACWFTKLDFRSGYHQIRMEPEDAYKTAFRTHSGHFE